jgi:hypothetical protein
MEYQFWREHYPNLGISKTLLSQHSVPYAIAQFGIHWHNKHRMSFALHIQLFWLYYQLEGHQL